MTMVRRKLGRAEFNKLGSNRVKAIRGRRDAEEMQPWRCVGCGQAVRRGYNDPCACFPKEVTK